MVNSISIRTLVKCNVNNAVEKQNNLKNSSKYGSIFF